MANKVRIKVKLKSTESSCFYTTTIKKVPNAGKLRLRKHDWILRKHTTFEQAKI